MRTAIFFFLCTSLANILVAQDSTKLVFTFKIDQEIDPRTNRLTELALDEAQNMEADLVIIEMDTYGGALNDADDIRTRILNYEIPIYVFINKDAASAGALISIACDSIYMAKAASIGAATVVTGDGAAAPDKYQSYMRSIMRSTAEAQGRDPKIAEAMVDEDVVVDSVSQAGKVVTLSTSEAINYGFCEGQYESIEEILAATGYTPYEIYDYELGSTEQIIAFFLNPVISGVLILVIIGGIYFELQTPGVGFPILASLVATILYFTPYYLNGLAENWEIAVFFVGIALILLEVFVIPGFGIAGIAGIFLSLGSLVLVMLNNDMLDFSFVPSEKLFISIGTIIAGLLGSIIVMFLGGVRLANSNVFKRIALQDVQDKDHGYVSIEHKVSMIGKRGEAYTILRPSGKVIIDEEIYDATSRDGFVSSGTKVEVVEEQGTWLKVKIINA
ncbi:MAG TPA: nodulation protein NfeD [Cyclobacteriaceae bacterium]